MYEGCMRGLLVLLETYCTPIWCNYLQCANAGDVASASSSLVFLSLCVLLAVVLCPPLTHA